MTNQQAQAYADRANQIEKGMISEMCDAEYQVWMSLPRNDRARIIFLAIESTRT